jgi:2-polyprenyl-6-methoxyphenol hydroxylase-like FAD-dependent oxidoreductase
MPLMQHPQVLIIGAGPTGLVLALWLAKTSIGVRIIDKAPRPGTTSRAIVIHPRSLEFYHQLGIAEEVVKKGVEIKGASLFVSGKRKGHVPFSNLKASMSPYQFMLGYPQDEQEQMLEDQLSALGIKVERNAELTSFEQTEHGVRAQLRNAAGEEEWCEATFLAGCDGAHSKVREVIAAGFPGGTYEETFYVADLKATGLFEQGEVNIALDEADFLAIFPLAAGGHVRLVGTIRPEAIKKEHIEWGDVSKDIINRMKIDIQELNWFSTYRVHHRVAAHFRKGNAFLLGDAGHIHSPVGGQGMNTGIGDAVNLAWKIAAVLQNSAPENILDTYEPERIAFAKRLVASTDRAFTFVSARGPFATWVRTRIAPYLVPWAFGFVPVRRCLFRIVSQLAINYRQSALSEGTAGKIRGGDRLPWVPPNGGAGNFNALTTLQWQVHIYGTAATSIRDLCHDRRIDLHIFSWNKSAQKAGLKKETVYVIRPDGYIGLVAGQADIKVITAYLDKWKISMA